MQLIAAALEKGASENEEATDRQLASLMEVSVKTSNDYGNRQQSKSRVR